MEDLDYYKKKCEEYEKRMGIGQFDPAKEGYLVLVNILTQQNEYLGNFKIKSKISSEDKAEATEYKNAKELWEKLPQMISNVNDLKISLKIEEGQKKISERPLSAKDIANGNI